MRKSQIQQLFPQPEALGNQARAGLPLNTAWRGSSIYEFETVDVTPQIKWISDNFIYSGTGRIGTISIAGEVAWSIDLFRDSRIPVPLVYGAMPLRIENDEAGIVLMKGKDPQFAYRTGRRSMIVTADGRIYKVGAREARKILIDANGKTILECAPAWKDSDTARRITYWSGHTEELSGEEGVLLAALLISSWPL